MTEDVLAAALDILAEGGYRALTIEAAARRAGVSRTAIYSRWHNLPALLIDVAIRAAPLPTGGFEKPATGSLASDLAAFVRQGMDLLDALQEVGIARPLLAESILTPSMNELVSEALFRGDEAVFGEIIEDAARRGEIRDQPAEAHVVFLALVGYALHRKFTLNIGLDDEEFDRLCEILVQGLRAAPAGEMQP